MSEEAISELDHGSDQYTSNEAALIKQKKKRINVRELDLKYNRKGKAKYYDIVGTAYRNYYYGKIRRLYPRVRLSERRKLFTPTKAKQAAFGKMAKVREDYRKPTRYPIPPPIGGGYKPPFPFQNYKKHFDEDSPMRCHRPYFAIYGSKGEYSGFFHSGGYFTADGNALVGISMWEVFMMSYRMLRVDGQCSGVPTETGAIRSSSPMERHKLYDQIARQIPAKPPVPPQRPRLAQEAWHNASKSIYSNYKYVNLDKDEAPMLTLNHYFRYRYSSEPEPLDEDRLDVAIGKLSSKASDSKKLEKAVQDILDTNPSDWQEIDKYLQKIGKPGVVDKVRGKAPAKKPSSKSSASKKSSSKSDAASFGIHENVKSFF